MQLSRRTAGTVAGIVVVIALVATAIVVLARDRGEFTETSARTGVSVTGPKKSRTDDPIVLREVTEHPPLPVPYELVGKVTEVRGRVDGPVTISLPYPADLPDDQAARLEVMRHDGEQWNALVPDRVDTARNRVEITTTGFSWWGLSRWAAERKVAELAADVRNILSSGGWWGLDKVGKFAVNPYITECALPALTVQLDVKKFVPESILCAKFTDDDPERRTHRLHISNTHGFPVMLRLSTGVTVEKITPEISNPFMRIIMQTLGGRRGITVLPGGGELVLRVDPRQLPEHREFAVSGSLDHLTTILDLASAIVRTVGTQRWNDKVVDDLVTSERIIDAAGCAMAQAERISALPEFTAKILAREYLVAVASCTSVELIAEIARRTAGLAYGMTADEVYERLQKLLPPKIKTVLTIWQEAFVLTQTVAAVLEARRGRAYLLKAKVVDPVRDDLHKVLPPPGKGGFESNGAAGPANGGAITYVGTECVTGQDWAAWQLPSGSASAGYRHADGKLDTQVVISYVNQQHRGAVEGLFAKLATTTGTCRREQDGTFVELDSSDGRTFGRPVDYRIGKAGWLNSEYLHMGTAAAYDPVKGVVVRVVMSSADVYLDVTPEQLREELAESIEYVTGRADLMLGTTFHRRP